MDDTIPDRVMATAAALELIGTLTAKYGPVLFHQSGGCCDGSSPMCYPQGDFIVGDRDVLLGTIGSAPVYISESQFAAWRHTHDVVLTGSEWSTDRVVGVVVDADGRLSVDAPANFARHFADERLAGVQSRVRIYNRRGWLTWAQDVEFAVFGAVYQLGRTAWGTARV